jgi:hypothetical protein
MVLQTSFLLSFHRVISRHALLASTAVLGEAEPDGVT